MATVKESTNEKGYWFTAAADGASLSLYYPHENGAPYSLYWHGLTNLQQIKMFIEHQFENGHADAAGLLVFTSNDRFQATTKFKDLEVTVPPDAQFLRVNCLSVPHEGQPTSTLIVWARLDLPKMPTAPGLSAPDEIGVHLSPQNYESIHEPLVSFISETHLHRVERSAITDCLEALSGHLRPANDYTYA